MSKSTVLSINALLNKALMTIKLASTDRIDKGIKEENGTQENRLTAKQKVLSYNPLTTCQPHTLHYAMKGVGYLPTPLLESLVGYWKGPTSKQYLHADAHLRLILAVNSKLKTPLELTPMHELRERFATDAVAMQAPQVWQQASDNIIGNMKRFTKKNQKLVHWEDKVIANADDGDMTIRCYQSDVSSHGLGFKKADTHNSDETVLLYFHGGGFCIGDVNTHHEFCHAVCEQTGWPIVSVDYRLAPEHPAPAALKDCITAYAWLAEHCHTLGALPSRIVLAGDSAGGGLSTLIAQQLTAPSQVAWSDLGSAGQKMFDLLERLPKPLAQMPLYPVTDIETDYPSWELYGEGLLLDHADVAVFDAACLDNSPLPRQHILNCPMLGDNSKVCPTYIVAAELDVLRDEAFAYAKQLKVHGIAVETHTILGAPHGFIHFMSIHQGIGQETGDIIKGFASFVRDVINTQSQLAA
ncbi:MULTISPECIES: alpha/beta hydrolase [Psychrobacter]|uniref:alpha/beta hydrolase n=1 Tax=Psychrobacter TaxID=497 RepID=UPI001EDCEC32|nr:MULTISPECIES: alpha/beta hydrolase [Psychrobacter]MCG3809648.1 alpha/beta hydrolase [Psychrobacter sp. Ps4]